MCYSQLSDFNFSVSATDETCSGNGALEMTVSNTTPGASMIYTLYLLPDSTNPIAETTANTFTSLQSGSYRVVATQMLGSEENSQQQDITINDLKTDLDFEISHNTTTNCDVNGTIVVTILSGNAVLYEIISGPVIVSAQDSNEFANLPSGTYIIRVFDNCGNALSKTYTMLLNTNNLSISDVTLPAVYNSCTQVEISNTISSFANVPLIYPFTITYTIHPPDGSANIIIVKDVTSGSSGGFDINQLISLFGDEPFTVNILITDTCGNEFQTDQLIDPNPKIRLFTAEAYCGKFLRLAINNFFPPYSVDFIDAPDGFNPIDYNTNFPGPYNESIITFGVEGNPVPYGTYIVHVVDVCGNIGTSSFEVEETPIDPIVITNNNGCDATSGFINISIPDRQITSAIITSAPANYGETLPNDVSEFIQNGVLNVQGNLPVGNYTLAITDNCGSEYSIDTSVPEFVFQQLTVVTKPNCQSATGSLKLKSNHGSLTSISITSAPQTFTENLPYDVSFNINSEGNFFMNDLPIGNYTFQAIDSCGFQYETAVAIFGYSSNPLAYTLTRNCGSFDVRINDFDESVTNQTYWLQKFNTATNTWGHPYSGATYTEGEIPNSTNAIQIENFDTLYNIFLVGDFRLRKVFQAFNSENSTNLCLDIFATFTVYSDLVISGVYNLSCSGGSGASDVILDVIGVEPYHFSITAPFVLDNGSNNTFSNLAPGTYEIKVEDACGSIENTTINLENLLPLVRVNTPDNILVCSDDAIDTGVFMLTNQNSQILGNQNPNNYNVTYHISQSDADTGNNPLPDVYSNMSNPQTIYARVTHHNLNICYATTSFDIFVGDVPLLSPDETNYICTDGTVTLTADSGFDAYEWSTGETSQSIVVSEAGTYTVSVKNNYDNFSCNATKVFTVNASEIATLEDVVISDWTATNNTISILASGIGTYQYSIDGIHFQPENTFTNLVPGMYTIYVKDMNGCGTVSDEVFLLNYPHFFTPNGDGQNDVWQIKFSSAEPELKVIIFDRYGKLLTTLSSQDYGWDGTYNGQKMPTSDYWFVVTRANGLKFKGHFTLKR
ncbi:MAG: T9SS type B sorting domain-containing protein [Gelidibacter sp.]|nr:T9SS type B sorting domain-containing protein [Gelidibacter sp.]